MLLKKKKLIFLSGTQKTTESYPLSVTTEYSARTTESTTGMVRVYDLFR